MECFSPISIRDPNGTSNAQRITVPCGRCHACLSNRRSEWITRLEFEKKASCNSHFVTLTYADPPLGGNDIPTLDKTDCQRWMKRLRKKLPKDSKIKYFTVGEYGSRSLRPHYHSIMFNLPDNPQEILEETWQNGLVHVGDVTEKSLNYTLKYILFSRKDSELYNYVEKPFALMSKGMGKNYLDERSEWHANDVNRNYVVKSSGQKVRLPRYYRDKMYSKSDKEQQLSYAQRRKAQENETREKLRATQEYKQYLERRAERKRSEGGKL